MLEAAEEEGESIDYEDSPLAELEEPRDNRLPYSH